MRRSVRAACILFLLSVAVLLGSCGSKPGGATSGKSLYEQGLEIISVMKEMAGNEDYIAFLSPDGGLKDLLSEAAAGDFSMPKAVYQIKVSESAFLELSELDLDALSVPLQENLKSRVAPAVFNQINAQGGVETLAAASVCTAGKTFVSSELTESMIYLYVYEDAVPVAVTFTKGEDGAVSALGTFVLYDEFPTDSASDIEGALSVFSAQVEEAAI